MRRNALSAVFAVLAVLALGPCRTETPRNAAELPISPSGSRYNPEPEKTPPRAAGGLWRYEICFLDPPILSCAGSGPIDRLACIPVDPPALDWKRRPAARLLWVDFYLGTVTWSAFDY